MLQFFIRLFKSTSAAVVEIFFFFQHTSFFTPFKCKIAHMLIFISLFTWLSFEREREKERDREREGEREGERERERVSTVSRIPMIFEWQAVLFENIQCSICDIHLLFTVRWPYLTINNPLKWQILIKKISITLINIANPQCNTFAPNKMIKELYGF